MERTQREIQTSGELEGRAAKQKIGAMTSIGPITTFKVCSGLGESRFKNFRIQIFCHTVSAL